MMKIHVVVAIVLATASTLSTSVYAQKVYRCGNNYSQTPCPDAIVIEVNDPRSKDQKIESDARVRHEGRIADAMEKKRLLEEKRALAANNPRAAAQGKKGSRAKNTQSISTASVQSDSDNTDKNAKASRSKKKSPEFFTARVMSDKKAKTTTTNTP